MNCRICGGTTAPCFQKHGYWIHACGRCGHQMAELTPTADHVDRIYGDHYFAGGGDGYPDYLAEAELLTAHGERYGVLLAHYMAPGTVLDVGAAAGLLQGLQRRGWHGVGLEPNGRMVAHGREQLGLDMLLGDLEHFAAEQRRAQFDLVTMIQVIGHFHDINRALSQAATLTKVGGYWLIESWDRASWPARLLGPQWHEYSPPSVLHWFARTDLVQLAAKHGFRLVAQGRPQKWLNAAHAKSLLRYKFAEVSGYALLNGLLRLVPDNLVLPYPTFDLFWVLLQKQNDDNV